MAQRRAVTRMAAAIRSVGCTSSAKGIDLPFAELTDLREPASEMSLDLVVGVLLAYGLVASLPILGPPLLGDDGCPSIDCYQVNRFAVAGVSFLA